MPLFTPLFRPYAFLLSAGLAVGCSPTEKDAEGDSAAAMAWYDTGTQAAPEDATWEADEEESDRASGAAASTNYDALRPRHPEVVETNGDNAYCAGDMVFVAFDLENTGDQDYLHSPGLILTSDHADVEIPDAAQWVESLSAGERVSLSWWAVVGPMVGSGDEVQFTASVSARDCEDSEDGCPVAHTASITLTVD
jgi:hypothetical protein